MPKGGLAFVCLTSLRMFRTAGSAKAKVIDEAGPSDIGNLAVSASGKWLYWTVTEKLDDGTETEEVKSLKL